MIQAKREGAAADEVGGTVGIAPLPAAADRGAGVRRGVCGEFVRHCVGVFCAFLAMLMMVSWGGCAGAKGSFEEESVMMREERAVMPDDAMRELMAGHERFLTGEPRQRDRSAEIRATAGGQQPIAAVLGCMDSRVPVETVFDQGIGDVFAIRVAGNVVNADVLGSLEYAVQAVRVPLIVVLGHRGCGAVKGACDSVELGHLTELLAKMEPAKRRVAESGEVSGTLDSKNTVYVDAVTKANVAVAIEQITAESEIIRQRVEAGRVKIVGGVYDVETGRVDFDL